MMKSELKRPLPTSLRRALLAAVFAALLGLTLASCSSTSPSSEAPPSGNQPESTGLPGLSSQPTVIGYAQMDIDTSARAGGSIETFNIEVTAGTTVYDVLRKSGVQFESESSSFGILITSIKGLKQGSDGPMSGWLYRIGNSYGEVAADKAEVKDGDLITWVYSPDGTYPGLEW